MNSADLIQVDIIKSDGDARAARKIRETVFVVEQQVPPEIEYDEFETSSIHILARLDGHPVGTARWRTTEFGQKLERFAVLKTVRGKGVGEALLKFILDQMDDTSTVYLNSQVSAIGFYARFGFKESGGIFYEAGIPHRKMIRKNS